ncbi:hypothetical protein [Novosphingobium sp.]|uniref:hypothetical protein n=1 Tax=Novosphingobium sp. TaxID=1874826 RepID=UPI003D13986B
MTDAAAKPWDSALVLTWLESRIVAAAGDQTRADKRGYEARDDYDEAAAEEWTCRAVRSAASEQAAFAGLIKHLLAQDDYLATGIYDDRRFERHVRANLRKLAKMTKANLGFENTLHFQ